MPVPTEALPWLAAVVAFFGSFILVIGGVQLSTLKD